MKNPIASLLVIPALIFLSLALSPVALSGNTGHSTGEFSASNLSGSYHFWILVNLTGTDLSSMPRGNSFLTLLKVKAEIQGEDEESINKVFHGQARKLTDGLNHEFGKVASMQRIGVKARKKILETKLEAHKFIETLNGYLTTSRMQTSLISTTDNGEIIYRFLSGKPAKRIEIYPITDPETELICVDKSDPFFGYRLNPEGVHEEVVESAYSAGGACRLPKEVADKLGHVANKQSKRRGMGYCPKKGA